MIYIHNPTSVRENETHKFTCNFEKQTGYLVSARSPVLVIINKKKKKRYVQKTKKTCIIVDFVVLADRTLEMKES